MKNQVSFILTGVTFAMLWASASVAGKFGLLSSEPLFLFNTRFLSAGLLLLAYTYIIKKENLPGRSEWKSLAIFGLLNTTLYLGLFVVALDSITPGITTLAVSLNPILISVFSSLWLGRQVRMNEWAGIIIGFAGITIASWPLLQESDASIKGLLILLASQISYSIGAVYYSSIPWKRSRISINAWQVMLGGMFLIPFTILFHEKENHLDLRFFLALGWLVIPVSIIAIQLWLRLLREDTVKASLWLFLCPVFGFAYANILMDEPITVYTIIGTVLVLIALFLGQQKREHAS